MFVLRPIRKNELSQLYSLVQSIEGSLTSLPLNEEFLDDRIHESIRAFSPRVRKAGGESYLFVLEQTKTGELCGTSGIVSRVGGFDPFYSYKIHREKLVHKPSKTEREIPVLHLHETHSGPSEICSLFLRPDCRRAGTGRLLSLGRFHFMQAFPQRFDTTVIAEMRGYIDQTGRSPFWEAVGKHFIDYDFSTADFLVGLGNKDFIADLMPRHPIYLSLLPEEVQAVIGRVHTQTQPALAMLESEGFQSTDEIDIFDAGPCVRASLQEIRTLRLATTSTIRDLETLAHDAVIQLLSNARLDFRACLGAVKPHSDGSVSIDSAVALALQLQPGENVTWSPLK
ncbi:MAG: arginine N-succinyltransferase [Pirellulaceae bacterium]|nr:arginine N-succinyltransferase [Pirellulaceae bacterium]